MGNPVNELGEKIFLDRYSLKDMNKDTLAVGDTVLVCVNQKTRQREIGIVKELSDRTSPVVITLRDGSEVSHSWDDVDKPLELKPEETMARTARGLAAIEETPAKRTEWEKKFNWLLDDWRFVPGGRILAAAGTDQQLTYFNCYVIPSPKDSRQGIIHTLLEMTEIMSRGGGVGINLSTLRPQHAYVKGVNGRSSGSVSWGGLYSFATGLIEQGGSRRGALMLILNDWHPDILNFIDAKREAGRITNANISVGVSDDFMAAVDANADWELKFPDATHPAYAEEWDGNIKRWTGKGYPVIVYKTMPAREIWDRLIGSAWASAEPGVFFIDTANKESNSHYFNDLIATNPCLTGDTKVAVADGRGSVAIKQLAKEGKDVDVYCVNKNGKISVRKMRNPRVTGRGIEVYRVTIEGGHSFTATANHKMIMRGLGEKQVKDLKVGDSLWIGYRGKSSMTQALFGVKEQRENNYWFVRGCKNKRWTPEHRLTAERIYGKIETGNHVHHIDHNSLNNSQDNLEIVNAEVHAMHHAAESSERMRSNNPMTALSNDPVRLAKYGKNMSAAVSGTLNGRYDHETTSEELFEQVKALTKKMKRKITKAEWQEHAKAIGSMTHMSAERFKQLQVSGLGELFEMAAEAVGVKAVSMKKIGTAKTKMEQALDQGYEARFIVDQTDVEVKRNCEVCGKTYWISFGYREVAFCGNKCGIKYKAKRESQRLATFEDKKRTEMMEKRDKQVEAYITLATDLGREPAWDEYADRLKSIGVSSRIKGNQYAFQSYAEIKEAAEVFNHKVVSIELVGRETVYNGTVDDFHNFCIHVGDEAVKSIGDNRAQLLLGTMNCGEQALSAYSVCLLGAINLSRFVTGASQLDVENLVKTVKYAVRFMDNVIDATPYFLEENEKQQKGERRIGLGIMGLAELLVRLKVRYGSHAGNLKIEEISKIMAIAAYEASCELAEEKGPFSKFDAALLESGYAKRLPEDLKEKIRLHGLRNVTLLTVAPTGTTGTMVGTSTGIEPYYSWSYWRTSRLGVHEETVPVAKEWLDANPGKELPDYFVSAMDLAPEEHVLAQASMQKWIDSAISKTCNAPNDYTVEQTKALYELLYKTGCKGGTIYRDGCRQEQVLSLKNDDKKDEAKDEAKVKEETKKLAKSDKSLRDRPKMTNGFTVEKDSPLGHVFTTLNMDTEGEPLELFINAGKTGSDVSSMTEALGRVVSLLLRVESVMSPEERLSMVVDQFEGIGGSNPVGFGKNKIKSLPEAVSKAIGEILAHRMLSKAFKEPIKAIAGVAALVETAEHRVDKVETPKTVVKGRKKPKPDLCPQCGEATFIREEGCQHCTSCNHSRCG